MSSTNRNAAVGRSLHVRAILCGSVLWTGCAATVSAQDRDTLYAQVSSTAQSIQRLDLGHNLVIEGGEADAQTLRIVVTVPEEMEDKVDTLFGGLLAGACSNQQISGLLAAGAAVEYAFSSAASAKPTIIGLSPATCGVVATGSLPSRAAAPADIETALAEMAEHQPDEFVFDGLTFEAAEADGRTLRVAVSVDQRARENGLSFSESVATLACDDDQLRELLRAGAEIVYAPRMQTGMADIAPVSITEKVCVAE